MKTMKVEILGGNLASSKLLSSCGKAELKIIETSDGKHIGHRASYGGSKNSDGSMSEEIYCRDCQETIYCADTTPGHGEWGYRPEYKFGGGYICPHANTEWSHNLEGHNTETCLDCGEEIDNDFWKLEEV
jgi:hypothetical protein